MYLSVIMRESTPSQYVLAHWKQFLISAAKGIESMIVNHIGHTLSLPIAAMAFYGLLDGKWDRTRLKFEAVVMLGFLSIVIPLSIFGLLSSGFGRYLLPIIPVSLMWCSKGIEGLLNRAGGSSCFPRSISGRDRLRFTRIFVFSICVSYFLIGIALVPGIKYGLGLDRAYLEASKETGVWIRKHSHGGSVVCTNNSTISFYSKRRAVKKPIGSITEIEGYLIREGADYIVFGMVGRYEKMMQPLPDRFALVYENRKAKKKIQVYHRKIANYL